MIHFFLFFPPGSIMLSVSALSLLHEACQCRIRVTTHFGIHVMNPTTPSGGLILPDARSPVPCLILPWWFRRWTRPGYTSSRNRCDIYVKKDNIDHLTYLFPAWGMGITGSFVLIMMPSNDRWDISMTKINEYYLLLVRPFQWATGAWSVAWGGWGTGLLYKCFPSYFQW
jgi:hypothetical protein